MHATKHLLTRKNSCLKLSRDSVIVRTSYGRTDPLILPSLVSLFLVVTSFIHLVSTGKFALGVQADL